MIFIGTKIKWNFVFEALAFLWFKLAFVVLLVFGAHLLLATQGIVLPINLFTISTITFLGVPGIACIAFATFLYNF